MKTYPKYLLYIILIEITTCCQLRKDERQFKRELESISLARGEIALCVSGAAQFGKVEFDLGCSGSGQSDFNLATALLHSFEYTEAEKVFAKIIDKTPDCPMAYWGVAMSNFHPLWAPPTEEELVKGSRIIKLARSLKNKSVRESDYLEAVAALYDNWNKLNHNTRLLKFERAAESVYKKYPNDKEAAIFYALALRAAASPTDKSFARQKKAGNILNAIFPSVPNHPGIAHYLIHTYDYPELARLALPAARKYAAIAATSAHALHMPSHIFTRLGLWDESIQSNISSMSAAKCYAENTGIEGHWDEEVHGLDYLVYAYLQQARDEKVKEQIEYLRSMREVFPLNNKEAYTFAAAPTRYALERKDWKEAAALELKPIDFPWEDFPWERSNISFGKVLGAVHLHRDAAAKEALKTLQANHVKLTEKNKTYEANQVQIQIKASQGWMQFWKGNKNEGMRLMAEAAALEDATDKHPITPGEVLPARELLGDLYMEAGEYSKALEAYEVDLKRHPGRFNGLYGAGVAAQKSGNTKKAAIFFEQLLATAKFHDTKRPELVTAEMFLRQHRTISNWVYISQFNVAGR